MEKNTDLQIDKTKDELIAQAGEAAANYFRQGLNCAEAVLWSCMDMHSTELPREVVCMASGFGAGIGRTKNMCGAISGAVMALGLLKGRRNPLQPETMPERAKEIREIYPHFKQLVNDLEAQYGTLICKEMCRDYEDFEGRPRKRNCMDIVRFCAQLVEKYALEDNSEQK